MKEYKMLIPTNAATLKPGDQFIIIADKQALAYQCDCNDGRKIFATGEPLVDTFKMLPRVVFAHGYPVFLGGGCKMEPWRLVWVTDGGWEGSFSSLLIKLGN